MTTFTLGLGVSGTLGYDANYLSGALGRLPGDHRRHQELAQPVPTAAARPTSTTCGTRRSTAAASTSAPATDVLARGLTETLAAIDAKLGPGRAAATSTLEPVAGDNFAYVANYTTVNWYGDLEARDIDPDRRLVAATWSGRPAAADAARPPDTARTSIYSSSRGGNKLNAFESANLAGRRPRGQFSRTPTASRRRCRSGRRGRDPDRRQRGAQMVSFLRGRRRVPAHGRLFRDRVHVLGDIVDGARCS